MSATTTTDWLTRSDLFLATEKIVSSDPRGWKGDAGGFAFDHEQFIRIIEQLSYILTCLFDCARQPNGVDYLEGEFHRSVASLIAAIVVAEANAENFDFTTTANYLAETPAA